MKNQSRSLVLSLILVLTGCGGEDYQVQQVREEKAPSVLPTATPTPTPSPTATPSPSPTATPTPTPSPTPYAYSGGAGTIGSPFQLSNPSDVRSIGLNPAAYFTMTQSISFEYEAAMAPLPAFSGVLYGNNYELFKLKIQGTSEVKAALFTEVSGTIVQLRMAQAVMTGSQYVSGFAGHLTGMLSSCYISGTITSPSGGNGYNTGTGNPVYVTKSASATVPGTTMNVQFNGNTVTSIQ